MKRALYTTLSKLYYSKKTRMSCTNYYNQQNVHVYRGAIPSDLYLTTGTRENY